MLKQMHHLKHISEAGTLCNTDLPLVKINDAIVTKTAFFAPESSIVP